MKQKIFLIALLLTGIVTTKAQKVALKTNLLYDATSTINVGAEVSIAPQWTLDLSGSLNPWKFKDDKKFRIWMAQPEARYWFCQKFNGSFIGVHAMGGQFNAGNVKLPFGIAPKLKDYRFEGWYAGGGVVYGYQWILGPHWNFEAAVGFGYNYINYDKYKCGDCGSKEKGGHTNYVGPTKIAVSAIYLF